MLHAIPMNTLSMLLGPVQCYQVLVEPGLCALNFVVQLHHGLGHLLGADGVHLVSDQQPNSHLVKIFMDDVL